MTLSVNTPLQGGKYRIVRFISSGGFGCTYEAEHIMLEKRVAIKEFFVKDFCNRDETTAHVTVGTISKKGLVEKLRRKFVDEAKALCKLHHRGIVSVSDVFEENGTAYFVMDYVDGKSLSELVRAEGPLSEERAVRYIRKVAEALKYVHDNNRLHLDIKPGNIMIDSEDNPVLIDFGASKQYDEEAGENTSTLMGKTPGYAPPEQMSNSVVKFLPATDIYALGATLYKLLTGTTPPDASLIISGETLEPLPGTISDATRKAVVASMEINKNKRPQNVGEFLSMLDWGSDVGASSDDEAEVTVVTEAESQIDGGSQANVEHKSAAPEEEKSSAPSPKKKFGFAWIAVVLVVLVGGALGYMGVSKLREAGREAREQLAAEREALAAEQSELEERRQQFVADSIARSKRIQARRDSVARAEQLAKEQAAAEQKRKDQLAKEQAEKERLAKEEQRKREEAERVVEGELKLSEGRYVGEYKNGKPHGRGVIYFADNDAYNRKSYDGQWVNGVREGYGTEIWNNGGKYVGDFKNGLREGYGVDYYANGEKYVGNWKNDKREGKGVIYFADNDAYNRKSYDGQWVNGVREGYGTMIWNTGEKYVGDWKNGLREGYGVDYYANGDKHEGNWKNDKREGKGTYTWANGNKHEGDWKNGLREGPGVEYFANGGRRVGTWRNGKLHGNATYYFSDGRRENERWNDGVEVK